eukprot:Selendium_serpulae@DN6142_c0_g1_i1.p1
MTTAKGKELNTQLEHIPKDAHRKEDDNQYGLSVKPYSKVYSTARPEVVLPPEVDRKKIRAMPSTSGRVIVETRESETVHMPPVKQASSKELPTKEAPLPKETLRKEMPMKSMKSMPSKDFRRPKTSHSLRSQDSGGEPRKLKSKTSLPPAPPPLQEPVRMPSFSEVKAKHAQMIKDLEDSRNQMVADLARQRAEAQERVRQRESALEAEKARLAGEEAKRQREIDEELAKLKEQTEKDLKRLRDERARLEKQRAELARALRGLRDIGDERSHLITAQEDEEQNCLEAIDSAEAEMQRMLEERVCGDLRDRLTTLMCVHGHERDRCEVCRRWVHDDIPILPY